MAEISSLVTKACYTDMMKHFLFLIFFTATALKAQKTIHVLVALCDNKNQGIVPVPEKIGNGQDPGNNLYWGCGYGVKTFLKKQAEWKFIKQINNPTPSIYERVIFKHKTSGTYLVADAYDGAKMKETINEFLNYCAGKSKTEIAVDSVKLQIGGYSPLICFVGHNGLMDFNLSASPSHADTLKREAAVFACASKGYFSEPLKKAGAYPLIWTTHLMCPEAYTLVTMVNGWIKKEKAAVIREKVAYTYTQYHKCGIKGAMNLFVTGW